MKKQRQKGPASAAKLRPGHVCLLIALCFLTYANSMTGDFVWDDQFQVVRNETIRSLGNLPQAFSGSLWSFMYSEGGSGNDIFKRYYRPLQTVVYMFAYAIGGLSPWLFHLFNIALHTGTTVLVYIFAVQMGVEAITALLAAALFAVHPIHTEAVSWIAGVGDLSCGVFYFAGLCAFIYFLKHRKASSAWLFSLCFLGALLSKEVGITLPIAAGLLVLGLPGEIRPTRKDLPWLALPLGVLLVYTGLRINAVGLHVPDVIQAQLTTFDWATLVVWVLGQYARYSVFAYPLSVQHVIALRFADRAGSTALFALLLAAIVSLLWIGRRKVKGGLMWLGVSAAALLPVLYFQGSGILFAERYLYIPSAAIVILLSALIMRLAPRTGIPILIVLVAVFFAASFRRNRDWQNEDTLYRRTLDVEPRAVKFWNSLGLSVLERGENGQARSAFEQAQRYADDARFMQDSYEKYRTHLGLGIIAAREHRISEAKAELNRALEFEPQGDGAYATLAGISVNDDRDYATAVSLLNKALSINPRSELTRDYLGVALLNQGQLDQAVASFREALRINPNYEPAKLHLEFATRNAKP